MALISKHRPKIIVGREGACFKVRFDRLDECVLVPVRMFREAFFKSQELLDEYGREGNIREPSQKTREPSPDSEIEVDVVGDAEIQDEQHPPQQQHEQQQQQHREMSPDIIEIKEVPRKTARPPPARRGRYSDRKEPKEEFKVPQKAAKIRPKQPRKKVQSYKQFARKSAGSKMPLPRPKKEAVKKYLARKNNTSSKGPQPKPPKSSPKPPRAAAANHENSSPARSPSPVPEGHLLSEKLLNKAMRSR